MITQTYQDMHADGVFYQMPNSSDGVPPAAAAGHYVQSVLPTRISFENTAWTVNGKIGALKAIYTGGYLVRNLDQRNDYTSYARGVYADYYQCYGASGSAGGTGNARCFSPRDLLAGTVTQHPPDPRISAQHARRMAPARHHRRLLGKREIFDNTDWLYKTLPPCTTENQGGCLTNVAPAPGTTNNIPGTRNDNTAFFEDIQRGYKQYAFFTSIDFDIIPKVLTITGATRFIISITFRPAP